MKKETREKLYKISEVAEILGVHEDTLRNWEKEGFVVPERIGTRGDRRYTAEMIGEIRKKGLVSDLAKKGQKTKKDLAEYTKDELIKELQLLKRQKKYGLVWENHTEEVVERCKTEAPILVVKKDKQIKDKDKNKPINILIEGDNYHALQVLNYTHKGKIDVIYIDPPYNTGNKDFIYNDSYVDKEDNFRHSKWISFMESRLRLARNLLKKDGVIFISIDDNEMAQLKLLCNGIFGEENFVGAFVKQSKVGGGSDSKFVVKEHEYVLVYARNINIADSFFTEHDEEYLKRYKEVDEQGKYFWDTFARPGLKNPINYDVVAPDGTVINGDWIRSKTRFEKDILNGDIRFLKKKDDSWSVQFKQRLNVSGKKPRSMTSDFGGTIDGKNDLVSIFGDKIPFAYPKSIKYIKTLIKFTQKKDLLVLDFMAGSGTTGHAVLDLNKEDGGNRKFILCTNNELNGLEKELKEKGLSKEEIEEHGICRRITHQRIKKVIEGYKKPNGEKVKGLGGSLEYFKTEFVDVENIDKVSDKKKLEFTYEAGQMIALKEDTFKEVAKNKFYQIFTDEKDKFVGIYFRENLDKLPEMEKKILDKKDVRLYLFSYGVNDFKKDYTEYRNVIVKDIPEPILKIYKSLNN